MKSKKLSPYRMKHISSHKVTQLPLAYCPLHNHFSQLQTNCLDYISIKFHHKILTRNILADIDCEVELIFTAICKSVNEKQLETTNVVLGYADYYMLTKLCLYASRSLQSEGLAVYCVFGDYGYPQWFNVDTDSVLEYSHPVDVQCY
jgi:hypothetical protein